MPTFDLSAFLQRISGLIIKGLILSGIIRVCSLLYNVFKTPLALGTLVLMLAYYPDKVQWVLMKIGELEITAFAILLSVVFPDIFNSMSGELHSWQAIWSAGLQALPTNVVQVLNAVGVAELMGLVTSTLSAGSVVLLYRKIMSRMGI